MIESATRRCGASGEDIGTDPWDFQDDAATPRAGHEDRKRNGAQGRAGQIPTNSIAYLSSWQNQKSGLFG
jgi:hypothetical protein